MTHATQDNEQTSFQTIREMAFHMAGKLRMLEPHFQSEPDSWKWREHARECLSVGTALNIIAETPNAAINQEALDAFSARVREAHEALADWCETLLVPARDSELTEADIPY